MTVAVSESSMSAEMQIKVALEEGVGNIVLAVMGIDGLGFDDFSYEAVSTAEEGAVTLYQVTAKVTDQISQVTFESLIPVRQPDVNFLHYRIDDVPFNVSAGVGRTYQAWCEHNLCNGIAIVRFVTDSRVTWAVVGGLDDTIFHMDRPLAELNEHFRDIIRKHWADPEVVEQTTQ